MALHFGIRWLVAKTRSLIPPERWNREAFANTIGNKQSTDIL